MYAFMSCLFFFFQAEDGIRDYKVTGVQTCALPICLITFTVPLAKTNGPSNSVTATGPNWSAGGLSSVTQAPPSLSVENSRATVDPCANRAESVNFDSAGCGRSGLPRLAATRQM